MFVFPRILVPIFMTALCSAVAAAGTLHVGPGAAFTDIQSAVNAASDGDVILVAPGNYAPFAVVAKGVHVQGDPGFVVDDTSGDGVVRVLATAADQVVTLQGMDLTGLFSLGVGLEIEFCQGEVILEDVLVQDGQGYGHVLVRDSGAVFAAGLQVSGVMTHVTFPLRPIPIHIEGSSVSFFDLIVTGGGTYECLRIEDGSTVVLAGPKLTGVAGRDSSGCICDPDGGVGGAAMTIADSDVWITGVSPQFVRGGPGGQGSSCGVGGNGGLAVTGSSQLVAAPAVLIQGGAGGSGGLGSGSAGLDIDGSADRSQQLPLLTLNDALEVGGSGLLAVGGHPAGPAPLTVVLIFSTQGGFAPFGPLDGPPLSALFVPPFALVLGTTNAAGTLVLPFTVPMDNQLLGVPVHAQAGVLDPNGADYLSNVVVRSIRG